MKEHRVDLGQKTELKPEAWSRLGLKARAVTSNEFKTHLSVISKKLVMFLSSLFTYFALEYGETREFEICVKDQAKLRVVNTC